MRQVDILTLVTMTHTRRRAHAIDSILKPQQTVQCRPKICASKGAHSDIHSTQHPLTLPRRQFSHTRTDSAMHTNPMQCL